MTLAGSTDYLLKLSGLAVAFVGWSAIVVTLGHAFGSDRFSELHLYFVHLFIEGGLAVAALGVLPAALAFTRLPDSVIWRLSSVAAALTFSVYGIALFRRRHRVTPGRLPLRTTIVFAIFGASTLALWVNTVGSGLHPSPAVYALALTALLTVGGWVFVQNLGLFFGRPLSP